MIDPDGKYIVDSAARNIWRLGAECYLRNRKGWYLTATLLELSTYGSGQHFEAHNGEYAAPKSPPETSNAYVNVKNAYE